MDKKKLNAKEKKAKRKEELAKRRLLDEAVKGAYMKEDHLVDFPAFLKFDRNGVSITLESNGGPSLCSSLKQYIQDLLKVNMEGPYGIDWPDEEKVKRREMIATDALYIIARLNQVDVGKAETASDGDMQKSRENSHGLWKGTGARAVAFVQYRFVEEEDVPVLYVYEIQLEKVVQGRGLGKFLMQLLELIGRKCCIRESTQCQIALPPAIFYSQVCRLTLGAQTLHLSEGGGQNFGRLLPSLKFPQQRPKVKLWTQPNEDKDVYLSACYVG